MCCIFGCWPHLYFNIGVLFHDNLSAFLSHSLYKHQFSFFGVAYSRTQKTYWFLDRKETCFSVLAVHPSFVQKETLLGVSLCGQVLIFQDVY